ncbi:chaperone modulator CbpM [Elusimicrobiota bacterium]
MKPDPKDLFRFDERLREHLEMLAAIAEIESAFLEQCVWHGALRLEDLPEDRAQFTPSQLARLRRLQRICRSLDIDVFAGCIILDLLDRMDGLEHDLERLRAITQDETPAK